MVVQNGRRVLSYLYPDNTELVEELDVNSNEVLVRKWKRPREGQINSQQVAEWEYEIGDDNRKFNPETDLMSASDRNPQFMRKDTTARFEWRIRNLPYPKETYIIEVDHDKQQIVLKTTNKKYYKRIDIPDLKRLNMKMQEEAIAWKYANNTVIISYDKPAEVKAKEKEMLNLAHKAAMQSAGAQGGQDVGCKQQ